MPEAMRSSVRSATILFDMPRVVEELIFNSLDAGATKISIAVGAETCYLKVVDNGCGITRDGLVLLAERYATSKFDQREDSHVVAQSFGFRGEALSSIANISLLEVLTKAHGRPNGYRKVMKGSKCLYIGIDDDRKDVGTTVIVRDLFYNQPVRRKLIRSSTKKLLESVKKCVLRISLVHPQVSFKVVDIDSEEEIFCATPSSSPLSRLTSGYGVEVTSSLHELNVADGVLKLSGYVSSPCDTSSVKAFQYIYINSRHTSKGTIHKLLNQLASSFNYSEHPKGNMVTQIAKRSRIQNCSTFILNLCCPRSWYDITFEPSKTSVDFKDWKPITRFIEKAIMRFWAEIVSRDVVTGGTGVHMLAENGQVEGGDVHSRGEDFSDKCRTDKSEKADHLGCRKGDSISSHDIAYKSDSPVISYDEFPTISKVEVDREISIFETAADYNVFPNKDRLLGSKTFAPRKYINQVDYASESCFDEEHLNLGASLMNEKFKIDILRDPFEIEDADITGKVFGKPFLQSCASRKRKVLDEDLLRRPEELDERLTNEFLKSDLPSDPFQIGNVDNISKYLEKPLMQISWKRRVLDEESLRRSEEFEASFANQYIKSDLPSDPFEIGYMDNMNKDFEKPFLQSCISRKRRVFDEKALRKSEGLHFLTESFRYKRKCNLLAEFNFSPKNSEESILSGGDFHWENDLRMDSYSIFGSKYHDIVRDLDENSWRRYESSSEYDYLANSACTNPDFHYDDIVGSTSSREHCYSFRDVDTYSDIEKYAPTEDVLEFCPQHNLFDENFPRSSNIFNYETKWLSLDLGDGNCHAITSYHKLDSDKNQKSVEENVRKQRPRRSHSAPPFYRGKKIFIALSNHLVVEAEKCKYLSIDDPGSSQEVGELLHSKRSHAVCQLNSELNSVKDLSSYTRASKKGAERCGTEKVEMKEKLEGFQSTCTTLFEKVEMKEKLEGHLETSNEGKSHNPKEEDTILDVSSGLLHLAGDLLVPQSINKKFLKDAKVLQQVDKKFIPVVGNGVLAIIDQHAADERIRLEELRQRVLSGEKKAITYLDAEQTLVMPEIGHQLLHSYAEQIRNWGWLCNIHSQDSKSFERNLNILHKQPTGITLVAVPCILGVNLTDVDLLEFLQQLADTDGSSTIPPSVHRILNSKACRGAIMFGDALLPSECSLIVEELKQTSLCFQCAHGRPTTVPLVNLDALHKQIEKRGPWNEKFFDTWHGLRRHAPSLERATNRLLGLS